MFGPKQMQFSYNDPVKCVTRSRETCTLQRYAKQYFSKKNQYNFSHACHKMRNSSGPWVDLCLDNNVSGSSWYYLRQFINNSWFIVSRHDHNHVWKTPHRKLQPLVE